MYSSDQSDIPSRSFGLSSSLAGALTGILATIVVSLLCRGLSLIALSMAFFYPGYLILEKVDASNIVISGLTVSLIYYGVSFIPPAMIGALIFSERVLLRISGMVVLITHAILLLGFSFFLHIMLD